AAHQADLARREANAHPIGKLARHTALLEVGTRVATEVVLPEHAAEVIGRDAIDLPERLALVLLVDAPTLGLDDLDAGFLGHHLHGGGPVHAQALREKVEDVATLVTHEAVVHRLLR